MSRIRSNELRGLRRILRPPPAAPERFFFMVVDRGGIRSVRVAKARPETHAPGRVGGKSPEQRINDRLALQGSVREVHRVRPYGLRGRQVLHGANRSDRRRVTVKGLERRIDHFSVLEKRPLLSVGLERTSDEVAPDSRSSRTPPRHRVPGQETETLNCIRQGSPRAPPGRRASP